MSKPVEQTRAAALLMQHHSQLYGFLYACLGNHADVEDVLQEVSVIVMQKIQQLDSEKGFLPWVREIARLEALTFRKRASRTEQVFDATTFESLASAFQRLEKRTDWGERQQALTQCLDQLPAENRELIQMRYEDSNRSVEDLAMHLDRTVSATYSLLKRIRESLRQCVEGKLMGESV